MLDNNVTVNALGSFRYCNGIYFVEMCIALVTVLPDVLCEGWLRLNFEYLAQHSLKWGSLAH